MKTAINIFCKCALMFFLHILIAWLHTLIHLSLLNKFLLTFCSVPETLLGAGNIVVNNTYKKSCLFWW